MFGGTRPFFPRCALLSAMLLATASQVTRSSRLSPNGGAAVVEWTGTAFPAAPSQGQLTTERPAPP